MDAILEKTLISLYGIKLKDRTGNIDNFQGCSLYDNIDAGSGCIHETIAATPLPAVKTTEKTFSQICSEKVAELKALSTSKNLPIALMWSGGIDSTVALAALLQAENTNFHIITSKNSMYETSTTFAKVVNGEYASQGLVSVMYASEKTLEEYNSEYILVTGELGDQLFGTDVIWEKNPDMTPNRDKLKSDLLLPFRDYIDEKFLTADVEASLASCPFEIVSLADFWWWWNFTLKYHNVEYRLHEYTLEWTEADYVAKNNIHHFFGGDDWQRWSMTNKAENSRHILENDISLQKWPAKEYIYTVLGDAQYRDTMTKQGSLVFHGLFKEPELSIEDGHIEPENAWVPDPPDYDLANPPE